MTEPIWGGTLAADEAHVVARAAARVADCERHPFDGRQHEAVRYAGELSGDRFGASVIDHQSDGAVRKSGAGGNDEVQGGARVDRHGARDDRRRDLPRCNRGKRLVEPAQRSEAERARRDIAGRYRSEYPFDGRCAERPRPRSAFRSALRTMRPFGCRWPRGSQRRRSSCRCTCWRHSSTASHSGLGDAARAAKLADDAGETELRELRLPRPRCLVTVRAGLELHRRCDDCRFRGRGRRPDVA